MVCRLVRCLHSRRAVHDDGWNDFLLLMIANNLEPQITVLDEAVTSELADVAIYAQPSDSTSQR